MGHRNPNTLRMEFKNDATAFNGEKKASFENKGHLNNEISTLIYGMLENADLPTDFVRKIDDTNVEVKKSDHPDGRGRRPQPFRRQLLQAHRHRGRPRILPTGYRVFLQIQRTRRPPDHDDYIREWAWRTPDLIPWNPPFKSTPSSSAFSPSAGSSWWTSSSSSAASLRILPSLAWPMKSAPMAAAWDLKMGEKDGQGPLPPRPRRRHGSLRGSPRSFSASRIIESRWVAYRIWKAMSAESFTGTSMTGSGTFWKVFIVVATLVLVLGLVLWVWFALINR